MGLGWRPDRLVRSMIALILTLVVTVAAFVILLDRKDRRHEKTVADLCQRIQAPEVAVMQHQIAQTESFPTQEPEQQDPEVLEYIRQIEAYENSLVR